MFTLNKILLGYRSHGIGETEGKIVDMYWVKQVAPMYRGFRCRYEQEIEAADHQINCRHMHLNFCNDMSVREYD